MFAQCNPQHENDLKEVIKEIKRTEGGDSGMDVTRKNLQYHLTRRMRSLSLLLFFILYFYFSLSWPSSPPSLSLALNL